MIFCLFVFLPLRATGTTASEARILLETSRGAGKMEQGCPNFKPQEFKVALDIFLFVCLFIYINIYAPISLLQRLWLGISKDWLQGNKLSLFIFANFQNPEANPRQYPTIHLTMSWVYMDLG